MTTTTDHRQLTTTPAVLTVDPRHDSDWHALASGPYGSLFTSPPWLSAVCATYGFTPSAKIAFDDAGEPVGGFAWVPVADLRGDRLCSIPFSDWADPIVPDDATWHILVDGLFNPDTRLTVRCLHSDVPQRDPRLRVVGELAHHSTRLDVPIAELHRQVSAEARRNISKAEQSGVRIQASTDIDALRSFHRIHVRLRKHKYRLLAQPMELFEHIWEQFSQADAIVTMLAQVEDEPVAGGIYLAWNNVLYFKFAASLPEQLCRRPNDAIYWAGVRYAAERGMRMVDWGVSDLDQPGLLQFKRKYANDERRIVALRSTGQPSPAQVDGGRVLGEITQLLTDEAVPDDITKKAGRLLYRYFC